MASFKDRLEWQASDNFKELMGFNLKKRWETNYAGNETWSCKFGLKARYQECRRIIKLEFLNTSQEVVLLDNAEVHMHEVAEHYGIQHKKYPWTPRQEDVLMPLMRKKAPDTQLVYLPGERSLARSQQGF